GFDTGGCLEFEDAEKRIETVAAHVAESAATEVGPAAPGKGKVDVIVGARGSGTEPEIPIEAIGNRVGFLGAFEALRPEGEAGPIVEFADGTDGTGPDPFAKKARVFGSLITNGDLRCDAGFAGDFGDAARLVNGVRQWFLAEDVFVLAHSRSGDDRVEVI